MHNDHVYRPSDAEGESQGTPPESKLQFQWKVDFGTVLTLIGMLVTATVFYSTLVYRIEAQERNTTELKLTMEQQNTRITLLIDDIHSLSLKMTRIQTQFEDRFYQQLQLDRAQVDRANEHANDKRR